MIPDNEKQKDEGTQVVGTQAEARKRAWDLNTSVHFDSGDYQGIAYSCGCTFIYSMTGGFRNHYCGTC